MTQSLPGVVGHTETDDKQLDIQSQTGYLFK